MVIIINQTAFPPEAICSPVCPVLRRTVNISTKAVISHFHIESVFKELSLFFYSDGFSHFMFNCFLWVIDWIREDLIVIIMLKQ